MRGCTRATTRTPRRSDASADELIRSASTGGKHHRSRRASSSACGSCSRPSGTPNNLLSALLPPHDPPGRPSPPASPGDLVSAGNEDVMVVWRGHYKTPRVGINTGLAATFLVSSVCSLISAFLYVLSVRSLAFFTNMCYTA